MNAFIGFIILFATSHPAFSQSLTSLTKVDSNPSYLQINLGLENDTPLEKPLVAIENKYIDFHFLNISTKISGEFLPLETKPFLKASLYQEGDSHSTLRIYTDMDSPFLPGYQTSMSGNNFILTLKIPTLPASSSNVSTEKDSILKQEDSLHSYLLKATAGSILILFLILLSLGLRKLSLQRKGSRELRNNLQIFDSISLGTKHRISTIKIQDRTLVIATSVNDIKLLYTIEPTPPPPPPNLSSTVYRQPELPKISPPKQNEEQRNLRISRKKQIEREDFSQSSDTHNIDDVTNLIRQKLKNLPSF